MKYQPRKGFSSNDVVMTPWGLASGIVDHFRPAGALLDPCMGGGAFYDALKQWSEDVSWCEISDGRDFFDWDTPVDWIITNPPWSQIRPFLHHGMQLASNVVFLMTVNHAWTKARIRDMKDMGFGIREILLVDSPKEFPASGFQLGAVHYKAGWTGETKITTL